MFPGYAGKLLDSCFFVIVIIDLVIWRGNVLYTWQFCDCDLFGVVSLRDPLIGWLSDLQLGDKNATNWITWYISDE